jgi:hypothetical protein
MHRAVRHFSRRTLLKQAAAGGAIVAVAGDACLLR